jgi:hypothetical protein
MNVARNEAVNNGLFLLLFQIELFFNSFSIPRVRGISKPQRDARWMEKAITPARNARVREKRATTTPTPNPATLPLES